MRVNQIVITGLIAFATVAQGVAQSKLWYHNDSTGVTEYFEVPWEITDIKWEQRLSSTWFTINYKAYSALPEDAVYTIEIHFADFVIVYSSNYSFPGALSENGVDVIGRFGSHWLGSGEVWHAPEQIVLRVPFAIQDTPTVVVMRYLPSTACVQVASGGLFGSVVSYLWVKRNLRGALPGWPIQDVSWFQQRQLPTVTWQPGQTVSPPTEGDRPRLGDRLRGGSLWPRDISLIPDDGAVRLPGNKLIEWGLEQGWFPYGGFDASDAWVGLVGIDHNGDGQLQPSEIIGIIGRCEPGVGADNNFYVDEKGYVHWINYDAKGNKVRHYIYDPNRNILKIFDGSGNLIYQGEPWWWN